MSQMKRFTLNRSTSMVAGSLLVSGAVVLSSLFGGRGRALGGDETAAVPSYQIGAPLPGLNANLLQLSRAGQQMFTRVFTAQEGLGPIYNASSCVTCHSAGATGGGDPVGVATTFNVTHFAYINNQTFLDPVRDLGGLVQQKKSIRDDVAPNCSLSGETVPPIANATSLRNTPPVFGFGLLDAISDKDILSRENLNIDGIHGFANWGIELGAVEQSAIPNYPIQPYGPPRVGRFGWKAQTGTLFQFSSEPYNIELGFTSPFFPQEFTPTGAKYSALLPAGCNVATNPINDSDNAQSVALYQFQALLAPPPTLPKNAQAKDGENLFNQIGCQNCHVAQLQTGSVYNLLLADGTTTRVSQLENQAVHAYSDLLVHDMGTALADAGGANFGRVMGRADGAHWRTTPLWGLRFKKSLLHDGRTADARTAILTHGGEGQIVRDRFAGLCTADQDKVIAFLTTL